MMIRTQITVSKEDYRRAKKAARARGISLAEFVRGSLRAALPVANDRPWMQYAGMVASGDSTSSQRIDELIYGQKD